jgi:hypothetical protein
MDFTCIDWVGRLPGNNLLEPITAIPMGKFQARKVVDKIAEVKNKTTVVFCG